MSSNSKQQKRAKRAAAKAKQNRVSRNRPELFLPPIQELITAAYNSDRYEKLYEEMRAAQRTGLVEMFSVFLCDPVTKVVEDAYDEESYSIYAERVICIYHQWMHDSSWEEAREWASSDVVLRSYKEAVIQRLKTLD